MRQINIKYCTSPYVEEWDDGNNINFDGWSGDCKVEFNYVCSNATGVDVWKTIYDAPEVLSSSYDNKLNRITITFDQVMLNQNLTDFDINLEISGPNNPYTLSMNYTFSQNNLIFYFTPSPALVGGVGEMVNIQLIEVTKFKSFHKIPLKSMKIFRFEVLALEVNESTKSAGSGASYMFIASGVVSIGVSLLTGGSIELLWSLANTLQILFFFGMLDLYYTSDLLMVYTLMKYSNFDNPASQFLTEKIKSLYSFISSPISGGLLLVETNPPTPRRGIVFTSCEFVKTIPSPLTKNKVNHINKIIMTKLSLMHPCLFSKKINLC